MRILERIYEIRKKKKNGEKLTIDEQMIYDMDLALCIIGECLVDYSKEHSNIENTIENIRKALNKTDKDYN